MGLALLVLGLILFLGPHVFVTMREQRDGAVKRMGEWPYKALFAIVTIIMFEECVGPYRTPAIATVASANLPWWLLPLFVTWRFARSEHPFTRAIET